jgi:hypothetical protein
MLLVWFACLVDATRVGRVSTLLFVSDQEIDRAF